MGSVVVAFSGGVDSAYLAVRAHQLLGTRTLAVTAESASLAEVQRSQAARLAADFGFAHRFLPTAELDDARYVQNTPDRCYHCKAELFRWLIPLAQAEGYAHVAYGLSAPPPRRLPAGASGGPGSRGQSTGRAGLTKASRILSSPGAFHLGPSGALIGLPHRLRPSGHAPRFWARGGSRSRVRSFGFREFGSAPGAHGVG